LLALLYLVTLAAVVTYLLVTEPVGRAALA
jgi:hypothetical protein